MKGTLVVGLALILFVVIPFIFPKPLRYWSPKLGSGGELADISGMAKIYLAGNNVRNWNFSKHYLLVLIGDRVEVITRSKALLSVYDLLFSYPLWVFEGMEAGDIDIIVQVDSEYIVKFDFSISISVYLAGKPLPLYKLDEKTLGQKISTVLFGEKPSYTVSWSEKIFKYNTPRLYGVKIKKSDIENILSDLKSGEYSLVVRLRGSMGGGVVPRASFIGNWDELKISYKSNVNVERYFKFGVRVYDRYRNVLNGIHVDIYRKGVVHKLTTDITGKTPIIAVLLEEVKQGITIKVYDAEGNYNSTILFIDEGNYTKYKNKYIHVTLYPAPIKPQEKEKKKEEGEKKGYMGNVYGTVYLKDDPTKAVGYVGIHFINLKTGKEYTTKSDIRGTYYLKLPYGDYKVWVGKSNINARCEQDNIVEVFKKNVRVDLYIWYGKKPVIYQYVEPIFLICRSRSGYIVEPIDGMVKFWKDNEVIYSDSCSDFIAKPRLLKNTPITITVEPFGSKSFYSKTMKAVYNKKYILFIRGSTMNILTPKSNTTTFVFNVVVNNRKADCSGSIKPIGSGSGRSFAISNGVGKISVACGYIYEVTIIYMTYSWKLYVLAVNHVETISITLNYQDASTPQYNIIGYIGNIIDMVLAYYTTYPYMIIIPLTPILLYYYTKYRKKHSTEITV